MKLHPLVLLLASCNWSNTQFTKVVVKEPYQSLWRIDSNKYYEFDKKKKRQYWNDKAIDSTGLDLHGKVFTRNSLLGYSLKEEAYYFYSIDFNGKITYLNKVTGGGIYTTQNNFFLNRKISIRSDDQRITHFRERNFYKLDLIKATPSDFFDMEKITLLDSSDASDLCDIFELPNNKLIATVCFCDGGCTDFRYYLIDIASKEAKQLILNTKEPNNEFYKIKFIISNGQYSLVDITNYGGKRENGGFFIYDQTFKEISKALDHEISAIGANYKGGIYLSDNVKSKTDDGREVIITYVFSMPLERSLFQIFIDQPLFPEDIKKCSQYELDIIRNMVFAKHNFKFDSEFYQAYFNFYKFYRDPQKRNSRIKEVNHLLSKSDKHNLALLAKKDGK
jgi:hypothetical protein